MKKAIVVSLIFLLFLFACAKKEQVKQETQKVTQPTETTAQVVSSVDTDIGNLDELTNELDTSELDNLDADLSELDNLV